MLVKLEDGQCRTCGGQLEITDHDDCSMTVICLSPGCGDSYDVEPDAFGDGCMVYYFPLVMEQRYGREE